MKNIKKDGEYWIIDRYDPVLINAMKSLGGKWKLSEKAWVIDERNKDELFKVLEDLYGHNGIDEYEKCTIILDVPEDLGKEWSISLYQIAKRYSRDSAVSLASNCCVVSGGFHEAGGSKKNPAIEPLPGTRIKILDFPVKLLENIKTDYEILDNKKPSKISDEAKLSTSKLIKELEKRGYEVNKKIHIDEELIDNA